MKRFIGGCVVGIVLSFAIVGVAQYGNPAYDTPWTANPFGDSQIVVPNPQPGDVNRDGKLTASDIVAITYIMKWSHLADVNADNKINYDDANYLADYLFYHSGKAPKTLTRCRDLLVKRDCTDEPLSPMIRINGNNAK